jgi:hypothetical protein
MSASEPISILEATKFVSAPIYSPVLGGTLTPQPPKQYIILIAEYYVYLEEYIPFKLRFYKILLFSKDSQRKNEEDNNKFVIY